MTAKNERPRKGGRYVRDPSTGKLARLKPGEAPPSPQSPAKAEPPAKPKKGD